MGESIIDYERERVGDSLRESIGESIGESEEIKEDKWID